MFRALCILIAAILIGCAAFSVKGPTVGDDPVNLFYLGLAFWAFSFFPMEDVSSYNFKRRV